MTRVVRSRRGCRRRSPSPPCPPRAHCVSQDRRKPGRSIADRGRARVGALRSLVGAGTPPARTGRASRAADSRGEGGGKAFGLDLAHDAVVLVARDGDGFVDEHDGDAVAHVVAQLEARVVERVLVDEVIQRTLVLRAGKDLEQTWIEAHRQLLWIDAEAATL